MNPIRPTDDDLRRTLRMPKNLHTEQAAPITVGYSKVIIEELLRLRKETAR